MNKLFQILLVMLALSAGVFVMAHNCPGNPLRAYYGDGAERMSVDERNTAMENLGLNEPATSQYFRWLGDFFSGDMGISFKYKQPVASVIAKMLPNTLALGGLSYVVTFGLAIVLGAFCALHEDSLLDRIICKIGVISGSIPSFFMALMLILIFSVNLNILPAGGAYSYGNSGNPLDRLVHLILPVSVMVLEHLWYYAYMIRNKLMEEGRKDYVLLCKAEGLSSTKIIFRNCMRNIMPSLLAVMAIALPHILGGAYVVETIFGYPGIGTLSFEAAMYQDYNMLMALTVITGFAVLVFNFIAQEISEHIDPRMKYEKI